jgi:hypothetical protein
MLQKSTVFYKATFYQVQMEARTLSSGTVGALTGARSYATIEAIQWDFIQFVDLHAAEYGTWIEAWRAYTQQD